MFFSSASQRAGAIQTAFLLLFLLLFLCLFFLYLRLCKWGSHVVGCSTQQLQTTANNRNQPQTTANNRNQPQPTANNRKQPQTTANNHKQLQTAANVGSLKRHLPSNVFIVYYQWICFLLSLNVERVCVSTLVPKLFSFPLCLDPQ